MLSVHPLNHHVSHSFMCCAIPSFVTGRLCREARSEKHTFHGVSGKVRGFPHVVSPVLWCFQFWKWVIPVLHHTEQAFSGPPWYCPYLWKSSIFFSHKKISFSVVVHVPSSFRECALIQLASKWLPEPKNNIHTCFADKGGGCDKGCDWVWLGGWWRCSKTHHQNKFGDELVLCSCEFVLVYAQCFHPLNHDVSHSFMCCAIPSFVTGRLCREARSEKHTFHGVSGKVRGFPHVVSPVLWCFQFWKWVIPVFHHTEQAFSGPPWYCPYLWKSEHFFQSQKNLILGCCACAIFFQGVCSDTTCLKVAPWTQE